MSNNNGSIGAALMDEFKQMVADGRIPGIDLSQFKTPAELADFLKDAIKSSAKTLADISASKGTIPHDPSKQKGAFEVTPATKAGDDEDEEDDGLSENLSDIVNDLSSEAAEVKQRYDALVRSRAFIHGVRDLPDSDIPDHLVSMTAVLNDLDKILFDVDSIFRKLSAIDVAYGLDDSVVLNMILDQLNDLSVCVLPLTDLFHSKLDMILGCGWDPCEEEDDVCDGCEGCVSTRMATVSQRQAISRKVFLRGRCPALWWRVFACRTRRMPMKRAASRRMRQKGISRANWAPVPI